jgi:hypothetical protein
MTSDADPRAMMNLKLPAWSAAKFLDMQVGGVTLRALICRLGAGKWHWSIISLEGDGGALICAGLERTLATARETVSVELAKCLDDPTG